MCCGDPQNGDYAPLENMRIYQASPGGLCTVVTLRMTIALNERGRDALCARPVYRADTVLTIAVGLPMCTRGD